MTTTVENTVTPSSSLDETNIQIIGYAAMFLSCISFGTMFVPLRRYNCADGFFVQWIECGVVFIVGAIFYVCRGFPQFEPIACVGGFLYATGNVFSVPIIKGIGMGTGFLIWSSLQIIVGWGVARFGIFDLIAAEKVKNDTMNYIGIFLTIVSGILLVFVKQEIEGPKNSYDIKTKIEENGSEDSRFDLKSLLKKVPFLIMAVILACCHGLMMSPITYLTQKNSESSDSFKVFDYIFPFYSSIFLFSTFYFFLYAILMRKKCHVESNLIIPSIVYGVLWTAGMSLWFVSSDKLSQVVAYPCTARLPPLISGLIDVFVFRSIKENQSIIILGVSALIGVVSVILIALSNQI